MDVLFLRRKPQPPLDAFVETIWVFRQPSRPRALERVLPTGAAQLIVNLADDETRVYDPECPQQYTATCGTVLAGVHSRFQVIDTAEQEHVAGVAFKPGGVVAFMRVPADETSDADVPLSELWTPRSAAALRERLLDSTSLEAQLDILEQALRAACTPERAHPAVAFALRAFDRAPHTASVTAVTDAVGLSAKRFIDRFRMEVGLTPKRYCRIRRFQRAVAEAHRGDRVDWPQVALDCGYYDQAHFIHDFRAFAGITPTGYRSARTTFQNHVKFLQSSDAGI